MANRDGEFELVIDPGNEAHIIRFASVRLILESLESLIGRAVWLRFGDVKFGLYLTSSPEFGSIKFNLFAGVTLVGAIAVAGDVSQVTGVDLGGVLSGLQKVLAPEAAASPTEEEFAKDQGFRELAGLLATEAVRSGCPSVKIKRGDFEIELSNSNSLAFIDADVQRLRSELSKLEEELDATRSRQARGRRRVDEAVGARSETRPMRQIDVRRAELQERLDTLRRMQLRQSDDQR